MLMTGGLASWISLPPFCLSANPLVVMNDETEAAAREISIFAILAHWKTPGERAIFICLPEALSVAS